MTAHHMLSIKGRPALCPLAVTADGKLVTASGISNTDVINRAVLLLDFIEGSTPRGTT
ncbi:hypothetical protein ACF09E_11920 [Streptomyces sp. NPDC014891]|uniref:hypothetical protein n=1 Tax=Streptomyces sp. NPDC014891 TaxID=3364929 RepID=UPI0036FF7BCE